MTSGRRLARAPSGTRSPDRSGNDQDVEATMMLNGGGEEVGARAHNEQRARRHHPDP
jgi:hypothetical protein